MQILDSIYSKITDASNTSICLNVRVNSAKLVWILAGRDKMNFVSLTLLTENRRVMMKLSDVSLLQ